MQQIREQEKFSMQMQLSCMDWGKKQIKKIECNKEHIAAKEQQNQGKVWIDEEKLVTFIARLINAASETQIERLLLKR